MRIQCPKYKQSIWKSNFGSWQKLKFLPFQKECLDSEHCMFSQKRYYFTHKLFWVRLIQVVIRCQSQPVKSKKLDRETQEFTEKISKLRDTLKNESKRNDKNRSVKVGEVEIGNSSNSRGSQSLQVNFCLLSKLMAKANLLGIKTFFSVKNFLDEEKPGWW